MWPTFLAILSALALVIKRVRQRGLPAQLKEQQQPAPTVFVLNLVRLLSCIALSVISVVACVMRSGWEVELALAVFYVSILLLTFSAFLTRWSLELHLPSCLHIAHDLCPPHLNPPRRPLIHNLVHLLLSKYLAPCDVYTPAP